MKDHKFWSTQPVNGDNEGPVQTPTSIPTTPYQLKEGSYFVDLTESDVDEIHDFLRENYAEDASQLFRLTYSKEFILWQLNNPRKKPGYLVGARNHHNKLFGFVLAREHDLVIKHQNIKAVSVNYLCLKKELRGNYYAPIIIKEITRRANLNGIYQAVFTGDIVLPQNHISAKYYHRILNIDRLIMNGFCDRDMKLKLHFKDLYFNNKMREKTSIATIEDLKSAYEMVSQKSKHFFLHEVNTLEEFIYNHLTRDSIVYSLVNKENGKVLSFVSFFIINTLVVSNNEMIKTAYLYYHEGLDQLEMIKDALAYANSIGCDVLNMLDIMDNHKFIQPLGFREGDVYLNYYLFNYQIDGLKNRDIHLCLV